MKKSIAILSALIFALFLFGCGDSNKNGENDSERDGDDAEIDEDFVETDEDSVEIDEDSAETDENSVKTDEDSVETDENSVKTDEDSVETDEDFVETDEDFVETDEDSEEAIVIDEEKRVAQTTSFVNAARGGTIVQYDPSDPYSDVPLAVLVIPPGALEKNVDITMKIYEKTALENSEKLVSKIIEFEPRGLVFQKNLLVIIQNGEMENVATRGMGDSQPKTRFAPTVLNKKHWSYTNFNSAKLRVLRSSVLSGDPIMRDAYRIPANVASGDPIMDVASGDPIMNFASGDPIMNFASGDPIMFSASGSPVDVASGDPIMNSASGDPIMNIASGDPIMVKASGDPIMNFASGDPIMNFASGDPIMKIMSGDPIMMAVGHFSFYAFLKPDKQTNDEIECMEEGTPCVDKKSNLMWSAKSIAGMDWEKADDYCKNLYEGDSKTSYTDWRLPKIDELKTLVRNCNDENCPEDYSGRYSLFGDMNNLWSSYSNQESAWYMEFRNAKMKTDLKSAKLNVRCIRRSENSESYEIDSEITRPPEEDSDYFIFSGVGAINNPNGEPKISKIADIDLKLKRYPNRTISRDDPPYSFFAYDDQQGESIMLEVLGDPDPKAAQFYKTVVVAQLPAELANIVSEESGVTPFSPIVQLLSIELIADRQNPKNNVVKECVIAANRPQFDYSELANREMPKGKIQLYRDGEEPLAIGKSVKFGINVPLTSDSQEIIDMFQDVESEKDLCFCFNKEGEIDCPEICGSGSATPCTDLIGSLMWSEKTDKPMTWPEARIYCEDLEKGGYADWRLPTISELRTLVKDCESIMTGGACKITDDILSIPEEGDFRFNLHSCYDPALYDDSCKFENSQNFSIFNDAVALWSSSPVENTNYDSVWTIYFNNEQKIPGGLSDRDKNEQNRVHTRCVRSTR